MSENDLVFQIETFKWLLIHFGGEVFFNNTVLVQPTKKFFPDEVSSETEAAYATFLRVKSYAGMDNWDCYLIAQEPDQEVKIAPTLVVQGTEASPLGTFSIGSEKAAISYNPKLIQQPMQLVATLAHELSHYLTATAAEPPPGGWDNWEFATDLTAVFLGFGVFMANSAFNFQQFTDVDSQGWSSSRNGYLSETELCFALTIFCKLQNIEISTATQHLKPNVKKLLSLSLAELNRSPQIISELSDVKYKPRHTV